ncbi:MAG: hypothetical protein JSW25_09165, partial [Thermoplasmata archaeon]
HCLNICLENEIGDFDLAFAYEAMARAYAVKENWTEVERYTGYAKTASEQIEDDGNKEYFMGELDSLPKAP